MRLFVIADTHFGHTALSNRLNVRPQNFEERIIRNWRASISDEDLVIHLGDIFLGKSTNWSDYLPTLPGRKVLIVGNHDKKSYNWYLDNGFDFVCRSFTWEIHGLNILFSHEPVANGNHDLNIHGHLHVDDERHPKPDDERCYLVSLESNGYRPEMLKTIVEKWRKDLKTRN